MKLVLFTLLAFLVSKEIFAQNTGYAGKHVMLKTDIINGIRTGFQNLDAEIVVTRNIALTASYRKFSYAGTSGSHTTKLEGTVDLQRHFLQANLRDKTMSVPHTVHATVYPGKTVGSHLNLGFKYYFNKIIPAPLGLYASLEIGSGSAKLDYDYQTHYKVLVQSEYHDSWDIVEDRENIKSDCNFVYISFPAAGYLYIFFGRLVIDAKVSLDTFNSSVSSTFLAKYPYSYFSTNIGSGAIGNTTTGLSVYLKAGILIF